MKIVKTLIKSTACK